MIYILKYWKQGCFALLSFALAITTTLWLLKSNELTKFQLEIEKQNKQRLEAEQKLTQERLAKSATIDKQYTLELKAKNEEILDLRKSISNSRVYVSTTTVKQTTKSTTSASVDDATKTTELDSDFVTTLIDIAERADQCAIEHNGLINFVNEVYLGGESQ